MQGADEAELLGALGEKDLGRAFSITLSRPQQEGGWRAGEEGGHQGHQLGPGIVGDEE